MDTQSGMSLQDKKSHLSLAQIYSCLGTTHAAENIENILKHEIDINFKIPTHCGWTFSKPDLLGSTALHLAVIKNDAKSFKLLLDCGADFTIKDDKGFTALHRVIEKLRKESKNFWTAVIDDKFVKLTISAHIHFEDFSNPRNRDELSHFHIACMTNNSEAIEFFLNNGVAVDLAIDSKSAKFAGWTPLHFAARSYSLETIRTLLAKNANRGLKNANHMTASDLLVKRRIKLLHSLTIASDKKYCVEKIKVENEKIEETLRLLVDFNVDESSTSVDESTFNAICSLHDPSKCRYFQDRLLNSGYQKTFPTWTSLAATHFAANCNIETLKLLMSRNFSLTFQSSTNSITSLDILMNNEQVDNVAAILNLEPTLRDVVFSHGNSAQLSDLILAMRDADEFNAYLRHILVNLDRRVIRQSPLFCGDTALHLAVYFSERFKADDGPLTLIELCLKRGATVIARNTKGQTPIHVAFRQNKMKIAEFLLKHQRSLTNPVDDGGLSHLHVACALNNVRFVRDLVDHCVDINVVCKTKFGACKTVKLGYTPLHVAVVMGCLEIVKLLVNAGADINARDGEGYSPIHRALSSSDAKKCIDTLLAAESLEHRSVDKVELSHLHTACSVDNVEAANKLLELRADIDAMVVYKEGETESWLKSFANLTPLDIAVKEESSRTLELLLKRGADILMKRPNGAILLIDILKDKKYESLFLAKLWADEELQKRLLTEEGVSMLHVACRTFNLAAIADLLKNDDVDVNARVPEDNYHWGGRTPLHMFLFKASVDAMRDYESTLRLMLDKGASVTAVDINGFTPIYMYACYGTDRTHLRLLLDYHRDFALNPTNVDGLSHFHFACLANHVEVVRRFLESGVVDDVDQPMDPFFSGYGAGCSPIDLAVSTQARQIYGIQSQVETINLLLKHKADPLVEDVLGSTVLHTVAGSAPSRLQLLESFAENGAYSNHQNSKGETPFEKLLKSRNVSVEEIDFFLKHNCQVNSFNCISGEGYMSMLMSKKYHSVHQEKAFDRLVAASKECLRDEASRTIIHNIVACSEALISVDRYVELIDEFAKWGVDVDDQDEFGATALHVAANFGNLKATTALLRVGADVNIIDADEKSAFSYALESEVKSGSREDVIKRLVNHAYKLQYLKLDLSKLNESLLKNNSPNIDSTFESDLMKCMSTKHNSIDLGGFLSETRMVAKYCTMITSERAKIDRFFETFHKNDDLMQLKDVLRLQYRKAVARLRLNGPSIRTVEESLDWQLPNVPCRRIVRCMSNSDLKGLIATTCEEDEAMDVEEGEMAVTGYEMMVIDLN